MPVIPESAVIGYRTVNFQETVCFLESITAGPESGSGRASVCGSPSLFGNRYCRTEVLARTGVPHLGRASATAGPGH